MKVKIPWAWAQGILFYSAFLFWQLSRIFYVSECRKWQPHTCAYQPQKYCLAPAFRRIPQDLGRNCDKIHFGRDRFPVLPFVLLHKYIHHLFINSRIAVCSVSILDLSSGFYHIHQQSLGTAGTVGPTPRLDREFTSKTRLLLREKNLRLRLERIPYIRMIWT